MVKEGNPKYTSPFQLVINTIILFFKPGTSLKYKGGFAVSTDADQSQYWSAWKKVAYLRQEQSRNRIPIQIRNVDELTSTSRRTAPHRLVFEEFHSYTGFLSIQTHSDLPISECINRKAKPLLAHNYATRQVTIL